MKIKAAAITVGVVWFGVIYSMIFSSVGALLSTIAWIYISYPLPIKASTPGVFFIVLDYAEYIDRLKVY